MDQDRPSSQWWPTFGVMLGGLTVALNQGVLQVAIPTMMSSLSADLDRIQWVSSVYQIVQAVIIPAVGWLGARLGTKRLFLIATLIFITGSALSGLAWDVHSLARALHPAASRAGILPFALGDSDPPRSPR